jgi:hypothetical protein
LNSAPALGKLRRVEVIISCRMAPVRFAVLLASAFFAIGFLSVSIAEGQSAWVQLQGSSPEHAFVLDVPKGWTAKARAFRLGYSDVRLMVDLRSPDGKTNVRPRSAFLRMRSRPRTIPAKGNSSIWERRRN